MTGGLAIGRAEVTRLFVASAPINMVLLDLDQRFVEVSPATLADGDLPREALIGRRVDEIVPDYDDNLGRVMRLLGEGRAVVEDVRIVPMVDGRIRRVRTIASYWRDDDGAPIGVLIVNQDMTAEHEADQSRRDSETQLRAVVDNLPAAIGVIDLDSEEITLLNRRMQRDLQLCADDLVGKPYHAVLDAEESATMARFISAAETAGGWVEVEQTFDVGPWTGRLVRMKCIIFTDPRGRRKMIWIGEDVTTLREATVALERAAAEAEAANRAKSEFLANMSHEIRTPLNGVMGVAGALGRTRLDPNQQEMVSIIETSAKTLETLLSDILDLARVEEGRMELRSEPFDLGESVNACAALFEAAAREKGVALEVAIAPDALGAYEGDAPRLRQILSNLLGNAVKFTEQGFVRLSVAAGHGAAGSTLRFEVRDSGIGFTGEAKARLFSRFEQADGSIRRRFGGSGLGLSISRALAEAMGGRLEADGEPGQGASFVLTLDLRRARKGEDPDPAEPDASAGTDPLGGMRVLLAEDHAVNRRVVELILGAAGVQLTCVENGAEAVEAFTRNRFDLILMDMQMPVMDGLTAITQIRALEAVSGAPRTPIHVLTANAMPEHVTASHAAGADGHLSKPILADALLERVADVALAASEESPPRRAEGA
jgi:PAS domain S-box-containing protein